MFDTSQYILPAHLTQTLIDYAQQGIQTGDFLQAVLANDLFDAFGRADGENTYRMHEIVKFIYNEMPSGCHGSRERYKQWIESFKK